MIEEGEPVGFEALRHDERDAGTSLKRINEPERGEAMKLGPIQVYRLHPNSVKEAEYLRVVWKDGRLTVTYVRHNDPRGNEMYAQEWSVDCPKPLVTERHYQSADLTQFLDELERL